VQSNFLIYGANGYTGELTARMAVERGLRPVLAGRNAAQLVELAGRLGLEYRIFDLDETEALDRALSSTHAVLHCAGPFVHTHGRMAEACLRTGAHYLDISGEITGIGFYVVPTDCLAAHLKLRLPAASHLALAICTIGPARISRGTRKTFVEGLGDTGYVRKDGEMTRVPQASEVRVIDFGEGPIEVSRITLGDVFTAHHSTGIPNIETYFAMGRSDGRQTFANVLLHHLRSMRAFDSVKPAPISLTMYVPDARDSPLIVNS